MILGKQWTDEELQRHNEEKIDQMVSQIIDEAIQYAEAAPEIDREQIKESIHKNISEKTSEIHKSLISKYYAVLVTDEIVEDYKKVFLEGFRRSFCNIFGQAI